MRQIGVDALRSLKRIVSGEDDTSGFLREGRKPRNVHYVDLDDEKRMNLRGVAGAISGYGTERNLVARLSRADYDSMKVATSDQYMDEIFMLLKKFFKVGSPQWMTYTALHVAHRKPREDGKGDYSVIQNVAPVYAPPAELQKSKKQSTDKKKVYSLAQLFSDTYIMDKYQLPLKLLRDVQLLALTRPYDAAATVAQAMQAQSPTAKIVVEAGGYARTKLQAIAFIRDMAYGKKGQASYSSVVSGDTIFVYGPGQPEKGGWFVQGPLKHADSVVQIMTLVLVGGMHETMFLLAMETQILSIEIYDGRHYVSSSIISHARSEEIDLPAVSDEETLMLLSEDIRSRLDRLSGNIRPVLQNGQHVASSVQVSPNMLLMNDHIRKLESELTVAGKRVDQGGVPVTQDLLMQRVSGAYEPWSLRKPIPGEFAAILYHNGDTPILSRPFKVLNLGGVNVVSQMCRDVTHGMSGGALVALSDMALLGVHHGATVRNLIASAYTDTMNLDLLDMVSRMDVAMGTTVDNATAIYALLRSRGLSKGFSASAKRLVSLEDAAGVYMGSAYEIDHKYYTTCPPQQYYTTVGMLSFTQEVGFVSSAIKNESVVKPSLPLFRREPQLHEKVVVVVCNKGDHYISAETTIKQVGAGQRSFFLQSVDGFPCSLVGGMVISIQDGAFVGLFLRDTYSFGVGRLAMCVTVETEYTTSSLRSGMSLSEAVQRKLPMASVLVWDDKVLAEAFSVASHETKGGDCQELAALGLSYLRTALQTALRKGRIRIREWDTYLEAILNDHKLSSLLVELRLHEYVNLGAASIETQDALDVVHNRAQVMLALIQVIVMHEGTHTVNSICSMLGLVPEFGFTKGPYGDYGKLMRRPSELAFKDIAEDGSVRLVSPVD